jgi:hypothetical protein
VARHTQRNRVTVFLAVLTGLAIVATVVVVVLVVVDAVR